MFPTFNGSLTKVTNSEMYYGHSPSLVNISECLRVNISKTLHLFVSSPRKEIDQKYLVELTINEMNLETMHSKGLF